MSEMHTCALTLLQEGEAVCLGCGAYYIFQAVLTPAEMEEVILEVALTTATSPKSPPSTAPDVARSDDAGGGV